MTGRYPLRRRVSRRYALATAGVLIAPTVAGAQAPRAHVSAAVEENSAVYARMARQIWQWAELGYQEEQSSRLLQEQLRAAGFAVMAGVADMPTAFVASYGRGGPVIALLAEYDALPGLSQDTVAVRRPLHASGAGHACGHHLFGVGSVAAAIAVKQWLEQSGRPGTIRVYGTPAEEGGGGKVYMVRAGVFHDVDIALHWHPGDRNEVTVGSSLANRSAKFRFRGVASHASGAPERGRSALDGVEAMNYLANLMREHVPPVTRIHYVITRGGDAPNVVPDFAEVYYYVRHPDVRALEEIWARLLRAAEGAALGTGTRVEHEVVHGLYPLLPNDALAELMDANLRVVGGVQYTQSERRFAEQIHATLDAPARNLGSEQTVRSRNTSGSTDGSFGGGASTDVGDVSWVVPTAGLAAATWVPGTPAHSWQAVAAGGMSIGTKGMLVAAKTLALTAVELFADPSRIAAAREEFDRRRGPDFRYHALVGDRKPPLSYRQQQ